MSFMRGNIARVVTLCKQGPFCLRSFTTPPNTVIATAYNQFEPNHEEKNMKSRLMPIGATLIAALFCLPAMAQTATTATEWQNNATDRPPATTPGSGPGMRHMGHGMRGPRDCTKAPDPSACNAQREAHAKMHEACKGASGQARKQCHMEQMQNFDCSKARNSQRCEARKSAYKECQGQTGPAMHQCMQQKMPPVDCGKAADPARCAQHQQAREACKDRSGPEHKACLREQFKPR
jgi:hypothetical protein